MNNLDYENLSEEVLTELFSFLKKKKKKENNLKRISRHTIMDLGPDHSTYTKDDIIYSLKSAGISKNKLSDKHHKMIDEHIEKYNKANEDAMKIRKEIEDKHPDWNHGDDNIYMDKDLVNRFYKHGFALSNVKSEYYDMMNKIKGELSNKNLRESFISESNSSKIEDELNLKLDPDYARMVDEKGYLDPLRDYGYKPNIDEHAIIYGHNKNINKYKSAIHQTKLARSGKHHNRNLSKHIGDDEVVIGDHYDGDILNSEYTVNSKGNIHAYHMCGDGKKLISKDFKRFMKAYRNPTAHPMFDTTDYTDIGRFQDKYSKYGKIQTRIERGLARATGSSDSFNDHYEKYLLDPKNAKAYKYALKQHLKLRGKKK